MRTTNLNELGIRTDCKKGYESLKDHSTSLLKDHSTSMRIKNFDNVEVYFKDIENKLIDTIDRYKHGAIFGSVAWLTSIPILNALSKCNDVQIIVQKEDFLRPDLDQSGDKWKAELRQHYNNLKCDMNRYDFQEPICNLSVCDPSEVKAIRCLGNNNKDKSPANPRAHNKFLVFCDVRRFKGYYPVAVWTGSFNFTKNATKSFENALLLEDWDGDNPIMQAYLKEHHQLFALSEPLNWEDEWFSPEYRLGT